MCENELPSHVDSKLGSTIFMLQKIPNLFKFSLFQVHFYTLEPIFVTMFMLTVGHPGKK